MKLNVSLNDKTTQRFQTIKRSLGLSSNANIIRWLISKEYERIERLKVRKVFLPNATYRRLEQVAEKRGQTIYEYVDEITEGLLKQTT